MGAGLIRDSIPALWRPRDYLHAVALFQLSVSMDSSMLQRFQKRRSSRKVRDRRRSEQGPTTVFGSGNSGTLTDGALLIVND